MSNRSDAYQWMFHEILVSDEYFKAFTNAHSCSALDVPWQYNEHIYDLHDRLYKEIMKLFKKNATSKQLQILTLKIDGYTQCEIAEQIGVNQSSIAKAWQGSITYTDSLGRKLKDGKSRKYGGIIKKMRSLAKDSDVIQDILAELLELKSTDIF